MLEDFVNIFAYLCSLNNGFFAATQSTSPTVPNILSTGLEKNPCTIIIFSVDSGQRSMIVFLLSLRLSIFKY